ncbi:MAG: hypothetical protein U5L01_12025 [Rheinheimera sp.]|nr:hypothetical protein [Rheinheimera sp.]
MVNFPWLTSIHQQLVNLVNAQHLHHALLISGPDGVGASMSRGPTRKSFDVSATYSYRPLRCV